MNQIDPSWLTVSRNAFSPCQENMLMHYIPEVTNVVSLEEEPDKAEESESSGNKQKTYEERLAAAGIPFSD
jgi:hypothetical protein